MNETSSSEITEVSYGNENILERTLQTFSNIKEELAGCFDHTEVAMHVTIESLWNGFLQLKRNGVRMRTVTEVTAENISYVKKLTELFEVRHLTGVKSNFGVLDRKVCLLHSISHQEQSLSHAIISNAKALVEAQHYLFETLWNEAIPAEEKIMEIEEGVKPPFIETLRDPFETQKILDNLLKSASEEILIILPTTTATNKRLYQYEQEYLLQLLKNAAERGVKIRILINESASESIELEVLSTKSKSDVVEIQLLDKQQQNEVITVIVDKELCLTAEVKDDENDNEYDSIIEVLGLATYSNSESTVLSYVSIFETL